MKKIGLIINPVAGIGGKVGLKGSDGAEIQARARALGAVPESNEKAGITLRMLKQEEGQFELYTYPKEMGADAARAAGLDAKLIGDIMLEGTRPADTIKAAKEMYALGADLILFAGGDGTARNILDAVGTEVPVLGIPAGCKIHSAVYAINPRFAGELALQFIQGKVKEMREAEVMDIDEDLFRQNRVRARLYGYLKVPNARNLVQNLKSGRGNSETASIDGLSRYLADTMLKDTLYIIGPGSTTRAIMDKLGLPNTLLGVDLVYNRKLLAADVAEQGILCALEHCGKAKLIVTVIGGQGYVFGRGNQQLSANVIRRVGKANIIIAASKDKMLSLFGQSLYVDTGVEEVNQNLCGYYKVVVGYEDYVMFKISC